MGKKKKKQEEVAETAPKPFCYYCDKEFADERVLICHQLDKHFRCQECKAEAKGGPFAHKKGRCETLAGLQIHMFKAHKMQITEVPNAIPGRTDLAVEVYGCRGIPEDLLRERNAEAVLNICSNNDSGRVSTAIMPGHKEQITEPSKSAKWSQEYSVEEWMSKKQAEEEEIARMPQPPQPPLQMSNSSYMPQEASMSQLQQEFGNDVANAVAGAEVNARFSAAPTISGMQFNQRDKFSQMAQVEAAFDPNLEESTDALPSSGLARPNLPMPATSMRSRSRSRGRVKRSKSREVGTFADRTIYIVEAPIFSRLWLKQEFQKYGRVDVAHTGNRQNPKAEPPWVRFSSQSGAEAALKAIENGTCLCEGKRIKAEKRADKQVKREIPGWNSRYSRSERDMEVTSRDLRQNDRRRPNPRSERNMDITSRDLARQDRSRSNRNRRRSRSRSDSRRRRR